MMMAMIIIIIIIITVMGDYFVKRFVEYVILDIWIYFMVCHKENTIPYI